MKEEREDLHRPSSQPLPGFDSGPLEKSTGSRTEPHFSGFDEDDDHYEAPDRDTDYATGFREESVEEEEELFEELLPSELEEENDDALFEAQSEFLDAEAQTLAKGSGGEAFATALEALEDEQAAEPAPDKEPWQQDEEEQAWEEEDYVASWQDEEDLVEDDLIEEELEEHSVTAAEEANEERQQWLEEDPYIAEDGREKWPVGLIAVGALALVLVFAGGYGVIQQRAETREEIQELRAALATAASRAELDSGRAALQEARASNDQLRAQTQELARDNQRLQDTVAGLEAQVAALEASAQEATAAPAPPIEKPPAKTRAPDPAPAATPTSSPAKPAASAPVTTGPWFVNFGSYSQRPAAEAWAGKLQPAAGKVIIAEGGRDGRTFYRVRVIGLPDKPAAQQVARQLEKDWDLSELWVGKQ